MKQINLRLSDEEHAVLAEMAKDDHRSLNAMVIVLVEEERRRRGAQSRRSDTDG